VTIQPTPGISGPSVAVPGQPLTYTLAASETGLPANTNYSYSVQWGDGSPVQTLSRSHRHAGNARLHHDRILHGQPHGHRPERPRQRAGNDVRHRLYRGHGNRSL
jgi:hypothetical protein